MSLQKPEFKGYKIQYDFDLQEVKLNVAFKCNLEIQIKRGNQKTQTQNKVSLDLANKKALFNEQINLQATLYKNTENRQFSDKNVNFTVLISTNQGKRVVGSAKQSLSQLLNQNKENDFVPVKLMLQKCPDKGAYILFSVSYQIIQDMGIVDLDTLTSRSPTTVQTQSVLAFEEEQKQSLDGIGQSQKKMIGQNISSLNNLQQNTEEIQKKLMNNSQFKVKQGEENGQQQKSQSSTINNLFKSQIQQKQKQENQDQQNNQNISKTVILNKQQSIQDNKISENNEKENQNQNQNQNQEKQNQVIQNNQNVKELQNSNLFKKENQKNNIQNQNFEEKEKFLKVIDKLQTELQQTQQSQKQYQQQYNILKKENLDQKAKFLETQQKNLKLTAQLNELNEKQENGTQDLKKSLELMKNNQQKQEKQYQNDIQNKDKIIQDLKLQIENLQKGKNQENSEQQQKISQLQKENEKLQEELKISLVNSQTIQKNEDSTNIDFYKSQIKKLEKRLKKIDAEYQSQLQEKEEEFEETEQQNQELILKNQKQDMKLKNLQEDHNNLKKQFDILKEQYQNMETELVKSKQRLGDAINLSFEIGGASFVEKLQNALFN